MRTRRLLALAPLLMLLGACDERGYPNTDTEVIVIGGLGALLIICVTIVCVAICKYGD